MIDVDHNVALQKAASLWKISKMPDDEPNIIDSSTNYLIFINKLMNHRVSYEKRTIINQEGKCDVVKASANLRLTC